MGVLKRGLLFLASAGIVAVPAVIPSASRVSLVGNKTPVTSPAIPGSGQYEPNQIEFYLDDASVSYVQPGLVVSILSVTNVAPAQKPVVEFTITDDMKQPLDLLGQTTPGPVSMRFVISTWDEASRTYTDLLVAANGDPTRDTAGTYTTVTTGRYKYTFSVALPNFDVTKPTTLFVGARRVLTDIIGKDYWANVFKDFVPATGAVPAYIWAQTSLAKCNACHDPLALHGGNYRDIKACMMCHNPNNMTGTALSQFNGQVFFHAIHTSKSSAIGTITYPQDIRNCVNCHDATVRGGSSWFSYPSRAACGSCHNDINWVTGANHPAGPMTDDTRCASCHSPVGDMEFDASIIGAHTVPAKSAQLKGIKLEFLSVANVAKGQKPVLKFKITSGTSTIVDPNTLIAPVGSLALRMAGPTTDYGWYKSESVSATNKVAFDGTIGTYTFTNAVPADFKGTLAFTGDCYRNVELIRGDGKANIALREAAINPVLYAGVTDATPVPRRTAVTIAQCNRCHDRLALHGEQRLVIAECVTCHNAKESDVSRRPAGEAPAESVSFARMIHRIHTGDHLEQDFTVYGFGGSKNNYNEVTYPGDRRNCVACHTATGYQPPAPTGALPVTTERDYFSPQGSSTAACLGCHDTRDAAAHAYLNTIKAPLFAEACSTCHGANSDYSPAKVHAR